MDMLQHEKVCDKAGTGGLDGGKNQGKAGGEGMKALLCFFHSIAVDSRGDWQQMGGFGEMVDYPWSVDNCGVQRCADYRLF